MNESLATFLTVSITYRRPLYITQTDNIQGLFINKLRLANTYHWERNFSAANTIFAELLQTLLDLPAYEDFSTNITEKVN